MIGKSLGHIWGEWVTGVKFLLDMHHNFCPEVGVEFLCIVSYIQFLYVEFLIETLCRWEKWKGFKSLPKYVTEVIQCNQFRIIFPSRHRTDFQHRRRVFSSCAFRPTRPKRWWQTVSVTRSTTAVPSTWTTTCWQETWMLPLATPPTRNTSQSYGYGSRFNSTSVNSIWQSKYLMQSCQLWCHSSHMLCDVIFYK